jgi:hypothetical protein
MRCLVHNQCVQLMPLLPLPLVLLTLQLLMRSFAHVSCGCVPTTAASLPERQLPLQQQPRSPKDDAGKHKQAPADEVAVGGVSCSSLHASRRRQGAHPSQ